MVILNCQIIGILSKIIYILGMFRYLCVGLVFVSVFCLDFGGLLDTASSAVNTASSSISSAVGTTTSTANSIGNSVNSFANTTESLVASATDTLTSTAKSIVSSAQNDLNKIQSQTTSLINSALNTIEQASKKAINQTETYVSDAYNTVQDKFNELQNTTVATVNLAIQTVQNQVNNIVNTINNLSEQMCQNQCSSFFNLPCFLLFRCTDKIRNFCLAIILPIVAVIVIFVGCNTGLFTFPCFCKAIMFITGITCLIWLIKSKKKPEEEQKVRQKEEDQNAHPETDKRMIIRDQIKMSDQN